MTIEPTVEQLNNAATRTALTLARLLTHDEDERIPEALPVDVDQMQEVIIGLEDVASDYARRAFHNTPNAPFDDRPYAMLVHTSVACEVLRDVTTWVQKVARDSLPMHIAVEAALLAVLAWRLGEGRSRTWLFEAGRACAMNVAADVARATLTGSTVLPRQFQNGDAAVTDGVDEDRIDFATEQQAWQARADLANRAAVFHPADGPESTTAPGPDETPGLPCVEVAGIQCYTYLNGQTGQLKVSLHFDTAEPWLLTADGNVPVEVNVGGDTVFEG